MMMRYKLANKRSSRYSSSNNSSISECGKSTSIDARFSSSSFDAGKAQPKRVSLSSVTSYNDSSSPPCLLRGDTESPLPTPLFFPEKPSKRKLSAPPDICFTPIDASRALDFETPTSRLVVDGVDWSRTLLQAPKPTKAALISPRLTPDSTNGPSFEDVFENTKGGTPFPSGLYIPTGDETVAAGVLMALKQTKGDELILDEDDTESIDKIQERPLLHTPPRRRAKLSRAAKEACRDFREELLFPEVDEDEDFSEDEEPPRKKRRTTSRAAASKHLSSRPSPAQTQVNTPKLVVTKDKKERTARLAVPDDPNELNSLHCFVRSDLLEVFSLVDDTSKRGRSAAGVKGSRVGFRCVHCGHLSRKEKEGASMSIFYPKSLKDIYRSVCTWQRIHFKACKHVPQNLVEQYDYYKDIDRTRGKKKHWVESAYRLGLRDFDENRGGIVWKTTPVKGN